MEPTANEIKNRATSAGQYAGDKAKQVASDVSEQLERGQNMAQDFYETARERAEDALDVSVDFVKKHPISTIAGAAAIGLVAGLLLRGRRD
jgi:ElaB/YqjD/DUF883 family membrane-anchored ribosome-binding protein